MRTREVSKQKAVTPIAIYSNYLKRENKSFVFKITYLFFYSQCANCASIHFISNI